MPYPSGRSDKARRVVLLIDEDPKIGHLVRLSLHGPRCQVLATSKSTEGQQMAARFRPDLIILETSFSDADGFELTEKIRQATRGSGIVMLTSDPSALQRIRAIQLGVLELLEKPMDGRQLGERIEGIFSRLQQGELPRPIIGPGAESLRQTLMRVQKETRTGTLRLTRSGQTASLTIRKGEVQAVECGPLRDVEAIEAIGKQGDWEVSFNEGGPSLGFQPEPALESGVHDRPAGDLHDREDPTIKDLGPSEEDETEQLPALDKEPQERRARPVNQAERGENRFSIGAMEADDFYEEVETTPLQFVADSKKIMKEAVARTTRPPEPDTPSSSVTRRWLAEVGPLPLLMLVPNKSIRAALQQAAERLGYSVFCAANGINGYTTAIEHRPVAVIADLQISDMDGRDFVKAIRTDFCIGETPVILISSASLAPQVKTHGGATLVAPIIDGLEAALAPRAALYVRLSTGGKEALNGPVKPIGTTNLIQVLGATRFSGQLRMGKRELRSAELLFSDGVICGATIKVPDVSVGPLAMLQLVGYEWEDYDLSPKELGDDQVPLGSLDLIIEQARQQNNQFLSLVYHQGVQIEDVSVDSKALDLYLQTLAPSTLEILIRLMEGEPAAVLVLEGVTNSALAKSMLWELRQKAVISPTSMSALRPREPSGGVASISVPEAPRSRLLVALLAGAVTVLMAAGGYLFYWHVMR